MTYKDALCRSMKALAEDPKRLFVGYNIRYGSKANGTLEGIDENRLIETPVAENLVAGIATGLAINGWKPVVWFERFDFVLNASDAIVNHLDKMAELSDNQYAPSVIIRCNVGNTQSPLYSGPTHTQDFTDAFTSMLRMNVMPVRTVASVTNTYSELASKSDRSWMVVEYRDLYGIE